MKAEPTLQPRRPVAVVFAVAVLALVWVGAACSIVVYGGSRTNFAVLAAALWTVVWYLTLWRLWRGGPVAAHFVSRAAIGVPGIMLVSSPIFLWLVGDPLRIMLIDIPCALGVAAGLALRRSEVREWQSCRAQARMASHLS